MDESDSHQLESQTPERLLVEEQSSGAKMREISGQSTDASIDADAPAPPTIRHIVLSGGGAQGLSFYGFLREANKAGMWNIKDIKTIHGTSIGAFIGAIICMNFEWDILDDFLVKRPWHTIFKLDIQAYLRVFEKKGMVPKTMYEEAMKPLFAAKDLPLNATLQEFYDFTGIEWHSYTTELNQFELVDVSYKTHPNWTVAKALHCTSNLPIVFEPYIEENQLYIDGGTLVNYPINQCISNGADPDEILGLHKRNTIYDKIINDESSFFDYILGLLTRVFDRIVYHTEGEKPKIKYEYFIKDHVVNIENLVASTSSQEERSRLIRIGAELFHQTMDGLRPGDILTNAP
jgi:hypothetical protein